jgi:hypothetical protein
MPVFQFWLPATTCSFCHLVYVTACTAGHSRWMALASPTVSVGRAPAPMRTPPCVMLPGRMINILLPRLAIFSCTEALAPWLMLTMTRTAATPMIMPRVVRSERIAFRRSARNAMLTVMRRKRIDTS